MLGSGSPAGALRMVGRTTERNLLVKRSRLLAGLAVLAAAAGLGVRPTSPASAAPVVVSFAYTGGSQTFVVPAGVTSVDFEMCGARGGLTGPSQGGRGMRLTGSFPVTPGETLVVEVGGSPTGSAGGYNGGGNAARPSPVFLAGEGSPGGGATDIRRGGSALTDRIRVAGGGGGGGWVNSTTAGNDGGSSGDPTGSDGSEVQSVAGSAGRGGTASAGGAGGVAPSSAGDPGVLGLGGQGDGAGGGGGGGYYGGGGGAGANVFADNGGGGGGGSSLSAPGDVADATVCDGNGSAVLSYELAPITTTTSSTTTSSTTTSSPPADPPGPGPWAPPAAPITTDSSYAG